MPQVYAATPADSNLAAHTIVKAFIRNPFNMYLYNLMADPDNPPAGTEEMMALRIAATMGTELVLVVDDGDMRCAGVALWTPPQPEPLGWGAWFSRQAGLIYYMVMSLYYGNRGLNKKVVFIMSSL